MAIRPKSMTDISYNEPKGILFYVLASEGDFRQSVPKGTPGSVERDYETSDGKKGVKYERAARSITGTIESFTIYEGDYGKNINIAFVPEEDAPVTEHVTVSLSANSPFGESFLKRLPRIDVTKEVTISPYSFDADNGKTRRGVTIKQDDEKLDDFYSTYDEKKGEWKNEKGFPLPEGDTSKFDTDDWKAHFIKVRKYLLGQLEAHPLFLSVDGSSAPADTDVF